MTGSETAKTRTASIDVANSTPVALLLVTATPAALTAFGRVGFGTNLVYSLCIGLLTYAAIDLPRRRLWPQEEQRSTAGKS